MELHELCPARHGTRRHKSARRKFLGRQLARDGVECDRAVIGWEGEEL